MTEQPLTLTVEEAGRLLLVDPDRYSPQRLEDFVRTIMGALARE